MADASGLRPPGNQAAYKASTQKSVRALFAACLGSGLIIIGLCVYIWTSQTLGSSPETSLNVAVMSGIAVLSVLLAGVIALTRALGLADPREALGLPKGSVRAVLALLLAIVFVAVSSWTLGGMFSPTGSRVAEANLPKDQIDEFLKPYRGQDQFIVEEFLDEKSGKLDGKVYLKRGPLDAGLMDIAKQIVTISATVLVTVVGFYFGSKSASDAIRSASDTVSSVQKGLSDFGAAGQSSTPATQDTPSPTVSAASISTFAASASAKLSSVGAAPLQLIQRAKNDPTLAQSLKDQIAAAEVNYPIVLEKEKACRDAAAKAKEIVNANPSDLAAQLSDLQKIAARANHDFENAYALFNDAFTAIKAKVS